MMLGNLRFSTSYFSAGDLLSLPRCLSLIRCSRVKSKHTYLFLMCGGGGGGGTAQRHGVGPGAGAGVSVRRVATSLVTRKVSVHPRCFKREKEYELFPDETYKAAGFPQNPSQSGSRVINFKLWGKPTLLRQSGRVHPRVFSWGGLGENCRLAFGQNAQEVPKKVF